MSRPAALPNLLHRLREAEQPWAGELVELADVSVVGERRHRDVGDVVRVDERLRRLPGGKGDDTGEHVVAEVVLAEVLTEPRGAYDRQLRAGGSNGPLGLLGLGLTATGQQHQSRDSLRDGELGKCADRLDRAGHGEVGLVGNVGRCDAVERRTPGRSVLPVERRLGRA